MRKHPLARALRLDKMTLAALEATLRLYLDPRARHRARSPRCALAQTLDEVRARADRLRELWIGAGVAAGRLEVVETVARAGGGALPMAEVPERGRRGEVPEGEADERAAQLRRGEPAVVCRVRDGRLLIDLRAVGEDELQELAAAGLIALV